MVNGAAWDNDYLWRMRVAQLINRLHEGPVMAAWEVDQLDEAWLFAFYGLADLPRKQRPKQMLDRKFAEIRSKHPTYRKFQ